MSEPSGTSSTATAEATASDKPSGSAGTSEAEFLERQAQDARAAIAAALADAKAALAEGVVPATWARRYPMVAVGSALAAGFATALLAIPSRQQQELRRIEKIARALHPEPPKPAKPKKEEKADDGAAASSSFWATVLKEALAFARPLIAALVSSHLGGGAAAADGGADGHNADAPSAAPPPAAGPYRAPHVR